MKFSILSIHPKMALSFASEGLLSKAISKGVVEIEAIQIREFADPPHFRVDDKPYGGGAGMIFKVEPLARAIEKIRGEKKSRTRTIVLSAKGKSFTQKVAERLSKYDHLILVCGRYEGIDERVIEHYCDEEIRIGDYVLMGGEVAAGVIVETVARLVPGVLGNPESLVEESFSLPEGKEYVQYTRPQEFEGHRVPEVLLEGHHKKIEAWRREKKSSKKTKVRK